MSVPKKLILTISVFFMVSCARNRADTVYINGSIWTGVESASRAQAMAVKGEYLVTVGSNENVEHLKDSNTKIVDLQGRFVVPGLMDAHTHFMDGGFQLVRLNFREVDSPEDFVYKIDSAAQKLEPGQWILGGNWDHENGVVNYHITHGWTKFPKNILSLSTELICIWPLPIQKPCNWPASPVIPLIRLVVP